VDGYAVAGEPGLVTCVLDECEAMMRLGMELRYDPQAVVASRTAYPVFGNMSFPSLRGRANGERGACDGGNGRACYP
jgi:hypothetical protein